MNTNLIEIAFILDRSGSMASVKDAAISGFNQFLRDQRATPGQARLTLVLFDNEYLVPVDNIPVQEVVELNTDTYVPRNSTALLDAIGKTIDQIGQRLEQTPDAERPGKVIVAILTDGEENSSQEFTWKDVSSKIQHQTDTYQWEFLFLGANQDAIATAANLKIRPEFAACYSADIAGTTASQKAMSRKTLAIRKMACKAPMTVREKEDARTNMSDIVAEEDRKERGEGN